MSKVESISELNRICQKPDWKTVGNCLARNVTRKQAIYITWLLLHTPINADQVVAISIAIAIVGGLLFCTGSNIAFFFGALLFHLWYIFDHVDGQIARYRKEANYTGAFFDFLAHYIVNAVVFFTWGCYAAAFFKNSYLLALAFIASLSAILINLTFDTKYKVFFKALSEGRIVKETTSHEYKVNGSYFSIAKKAYIFLYKLTEIHVVLCLLLLFSIPGLFSSFSWIPALGFLCYSLLLPFVFVTKLIYMLRTHAIDKEIDQLTEIPENPMSDKNAAESIVNYES